MPATSPDQSPDPRLVVYDLSQRCTCSINALIAHRRSSDKEHDERIKRIRAVALAINSRWQLGELNLPGFSGLDLDPDLVELIYDPMRGL